MMNLTGFLTYQQFEQIILIWPTNYDQSSIEYCIARAEKKLELYVHPELIGARADISLQEFASKYPVNLAHLRNSIAFLAEWYVKAGIYANFLNVSATTGGSSYSQNFSGGENFMPPTVIEQLVLSKLYQRTNILDVSADNLETVFPGAESSVIPQKLLIWDEQLVVENELAIINTHYIFFIFEETKNNLTYWLLQIFAKIQNLTAEGELDWNFILNKPQIPTLPWLNFFQENPTEQNLWTFLNTQNAKIGDIVNVNGRFYTIFLFDSRPSGSYYLWNSQRHYENSQFETETTFLSCANQGNPLNQQIFKNVVHHENVLIHDPYGAQGVHNDLPLNRFLRYWDGTVDDLANPNLWQTIFGWPAESENDYSGVYQVFTKDSWKLDRNRINRVIYQNDETTSFSDEITFKLPVKSTKTVSFNDNELIPQSEVKNLINAGGGTQPWNGITWINENDFLEFRTLTVPSRGDLSVEQDRFGIKNQRIKYNGVGDFTISGTAYVENPNIVLPDTNYLYFSTTPFYFNSVNSPTFFAEIAFKGVDDTNLFYPSERYDYPKWTYIKSTDTPTHTVYQIVQNSHIINSYLKVVHFNTAERKFIINFKIYTTESI